MSAKWRSFHSEINNNGRVSLDGDRKRVSFVKIKIRAHVCVCVCVWFFLRLDASEAGLFEVNV